MLSKNLVPLLLKQKSCHLYHRSQVKNISSQLVFRSKFSFINAGLYNQINENFTDKEIQMQKQYKDIDDELDFLHKGFNEKYLDSFESASGNASQNNSWLVNETKDQEIINNSNDNLNNSNQSTTLKTDNQSANINSNNYTQVSENFSIYRGYLNFQQAMKLIEQVLTAQEKLQVAQQFFLQVKTQTREMDQKQKNLMFQLIQPVIKNINEDPSKHTTTTLYNLLNIARHDFLNINLNQKVLAQIKKYISSSYQSFEIDQIKQIFYACCMMHKDTQFVIIEPQMFRLWFSKIHAMVLSGERNERELIHFISYHHKNVDLFRKTHKYISHLLLSNTTDGVLQRSKNGELLKVFISIFCQHERGSIELIELFTNSLYNLIQHDLITITQFQAILRNILRSQLFMSSKAISSYPIESNLKQKIKQQIIQDSASESDGEKIEIAKSKIDFIQNQQKKSIPSSQQNQEILNVNEQKQNLPFKILDIFVNQKINELSCNQVLNVLNLYQSINAQNHKETVAALLGQFKSSFSVQCDNYFSYNIIIRVLSLFEIQNPQSYLQLFKQAPSTLTQVPNYYLQAANTLTILREMIPTAWNKQYDVTYQRLQNNIQNDSEKIKQQNVKHQQYTIYHKRKYLSLIEQVFERINVSFSIHHLVESTLVDFFIKPSSSNSKKQLLPQIPFTVDIITSFDEMGPGILNGNLTLKGKIFKSLDIPYIILKEEFCLSLLQLNSFQQDFALVKEIKSQLEEQK